MKNIQKFEQYTTKDIDVDIINEEMDHFGIVNINIDGEGWIKNAAIIEIKKAMRNLQGERHIFVDGEEVNPHR